MIDTNDQAAHIETQFFLYPAFHAAYPTTGEMGGG